MSRVTDDPLVKRSAALIAEARARREAEAEEQELRLLDEEAQRQEKELAKLERAAQRLAVKGIPQPKKPDMVGLRECNGTCGEWKPLDEDNFFVDKDGPGGFSRKCKDCDRAYQRERRARVRNGEHQPRRRPYPKENGRWPRRASS